MRETPVPDKADRKRPVEVRFLANGAGLEMIKIGCQSPARISSVPALVIRGYLRRMARGALAKIQKWTSMRTRMLGNFRVPPRGSAADLSEIVPGHCLPEGTDPVRPCGSHPRGSAAKSRTGMTKIMPVPGKWNVTVLPVGPPFGGLFQFPASIGWMRMW